MKDKDNNKDKKKKKMRQQRRPRSDSKTTQKYTRLPLLCRMMMIMIQVYGLEIKKFSKRRFIISILAKLRECRMTNLGIGQLAAHTINLWGLETFFRC